MRAGYTPEDVLRLLKNVEVARDAMLGEKEERTAEKVGFEDHPRAESLQSAPHCYGHNSMLQQTRTLSAPPAKLKTYQGGPDKYQKMIRGYLNVRLTSRASIFASLTIYRQIRR